VVVEVDQDQELQKPEVKQALESKLVTPDCLGCLGYLDYSDCLE